MLSTSRRGVRLQSLSGKPKSKLPAKIHSTIYARRQPQAHVRRHGKKRLLLDKALDLQNFNDWSRLVKAEQVANPCFHPYTQPFLPKGGWHPIQRIVGRVVIALNGPKPTLKAEVSDRPSDADEIGGSCCERATVCGGGRGRGSTTRRQDQRNQSCADALGGGRSHRKLLLRGDTLALKIPSHERRAPAASSAC